MAASKDVCVVEVWDPSRKVGMWRWDLLFCWPSNDWELELVNRFIFIIQKKRVCQE